MPTATAVLKSQKKQDQLATEVPFLLEPFKKDGKLVVPEIQGNENYTQYADLAKTLKAKMEEVNGAYDDLIKAAHEQHKKIIAKKKQYWNPLYDLFTAIQRRMTQYAEKKERERLAEQQRLQELAKQQEQDRLVAEAAHLESEGKVVEAAQVLEEAQDAQAPVVTVQSSVPQVSGTYQKSNPWTFEIVDSTKIRDEYWTPDIDAIKAIVKAKGPAAETIIGQGSIKIKRETTTVIRG